MEVREHQLSVQMQVHVSGLRRRIAGNAHEEARWAGLPAPSRQLPQAQRPKMKTGGSGRQRRWREYCATSAECLCRAALSDICTYSSICRLSLSNIDITPDGAVVTNGLGRYFNPLKAAKSFSPTPRNLAKSVAWLYNISVVTSRISGQSALTLASSQLVM